MEFDVVIGMEVHSQLLTSSKMFCGCGVEFGAEPNTLVCPVCLGMPGTLPQLNRRAVELGVITALALNCKINYTSFFARKNYFYPDLPKGYQISQHRVPIGEGGYVEIEVGEEIKRIGIRRVHIEEDSGKLFHTDEGVFVDYNRAGVPLVEIVTEPDITSPEEAVAYLKALRQILRYTGVSLADMEKGHFRCEPNVSLRPAGESGFGVRCEIKNLNSMRAVEQALSAEIARQRRVLMDGGSVESQTFLWDEKRKSAVPMREKETSAEYRYFEDPDLPPLVLSKEWVEELRDTLPELPLQRKARFVAQYGIRDYDAGVLTEERPLADFFEAVVKEGVSPRETAHFIEGPVLSYLGDSGRKIEDISPLHIAELIRLIEEGRINRNTAVSILPEVVESGKSPSSIVEEKGLAQVSSSDAVARVVEEVLSANPDELERYRAGEKKLFGFFMGEVMKRMQRKANPHVVKEVLREYLERRE